MSHAFILPENRSDDKSQDHLYFSDRTMDSWTLLQHRQSKTSYTLTVTMVAERNCTKSSGGEL